MINWKKVFSYDSLAIALVCLIISTFVVWQYKSVQVNEVRSKVENLKMTELQDELINQKHNNDQLNNRLTELIKENDSVKNKQSADTQLKEDLARASKIAGMSKVRGEGVVIELISKPDFAVSEINILEVLNELRAGGAEALEVNGERMVATSEVREAGNFMVINGQRTNSPFIIKAIGKLDDLYRSITMLGGVKENQEVFIEFKISKNMDIVISAVKDNGTILRDKYMKQDISAK